MFSPVKVGRFYRTVRHLRPVQVANRLIRRVPVPAVRPRPPLRPRASPLLEPADFTPADLVRPSRLRAYTLHYQHCVSEEAALRWIEENPPGKGPGWEPYPLSRRIVNWIKHLKHLPAGVLQSLAAQADYLHRRLEYHLLANHLLVNAKALAFAGTIFDHDAWLRTGVEILEREVKEQILEDGGHYERSPMYHALILEDLLDLVNLGRAYPGLMPDWSSTASRMLSWLEQMTHPDGEISFFNDAACGVAPPLQTLTEYAQRLGITADRVPLSDSGYVRLANRETIVFFDAAPIGPDYQPGHAHADTLSFELSHRCARILVNSGTSTYEDSAERKYQRSTRAHNTVVIDGRNSSEVWSVFRVGARARPTEIRTNRATWVEAAHDGYRPVIHRRRVELRDSDVLIYDSIAGGGSHRVDIFFHLFPGVDQECIILDPRFTRALERTTFHPQFDTAVPNQTVHGITNTACSVTYLSRVDLKLLASIPDVPEEFAA